LIENIKENLELKLPGILSWNRMAVKPIN